MNYFERLEKKLKDLNLSDEYRLKKAVRGTITLEHIPCGQEIVAKENTFFDKNRRCLKCLIEKETDEYTVIKKIPGDRRCNFEIKHIPCGHVFKKTFSEYERRGCKCPKCFSSFKHYTHDSFVKRVTSLDPDYLVESTFVNCEVKVTFRHTVCGETFEMTPSHFIEGRRCPICKSKSFGSSEEYFKKELEYYFGDEVILDDTYRGTNTSTKFIHTKCNNSFIRKPSFILTSGKENTFKCEHCGGVSYGVREITRLLDENNVAYVREYRISDCKNKNTLPFDFAIFDTDNDLKCLIEFDGSQHFFGWRNNKEQLKGIQLRDSIKTEYCKSNGIHLIRIPYTESDRIENILIDNNIITHSSSTIPMVENNPQQE